MVEEARGVWERRRPDQGGAQRRPFALFVEGDGPVVATAIHDGHALRPEVAAASALADAERRHEEDPFTAELTHVARTRVVARRSRFEVDLNRPREEAVYRYPQDAWGLDLWRYPLPEDVVERSLAEYDAFYARLGAVLARVQAREGNFVVLDLHSYNDRTDDRPAGNPDVNVGTGSLDRVRWGGLVEAFMADLRAYDPALAVGENVCFRGRELARWTHEHFAEHGCCLAVEFKKTYLDQSTGQLDKDRLQHLAAALGACGPGLRRELPAAG